MPKHETRNILLSNLRRKHSLVMEFSSLCNITKEDFLLKNSMKSVAWKLVPDPF